MNHEREAAHYGIHAVTNFMNWALDMDDFFHHKTRHWYFRLFRDNEVTRVYVYEEPVVIMVTNHSFEKDVMYILRHRVEHHIHDRFCRSDIIV